MHRILITVVLVAAVCYVGCRDNSGDPVAVSPPDPPAMTKDDSVIVNAHIVASAAEAFAAANGGVYPREPYYEENLDGQTLMGLLPGGVPLMDPYSYTRVSPSDGHAVSPGQVGYFHFWPNGYIVDGVGAQANTYIVWLTRNVPEDP